MRTATPHVIMTPTRAHVTLIGLVETIEGTAANGFMERKYNFNMSNDSFRGSDNLRAVAESFLD